MMRDSPVLWIVFNYVSFLFSRSIEAVESHADVVFSDGTDPHGVSGLDHLPAFNDHGHVSIPHGKVAWLHLVSWNLWSDGLLVCQAG